MNKKHTSWINHRGESLWNSDNKQGREYRNAEEKGYVQAAHQMVAVVPDREFYPPWITVIIRNPRLLVRYYQ